MSFPAFQTAVESDVFAQVAPGIYDRKDDIRKITRIARCTAPTPGVRCCHGTTKLCSVAVRIMPKVVVSTYSSLTFDFLS